MHYFSNKFSKNRQALGALRPLIWDIGDLKLHDLAEIVVSQMIMTKSNLKLFLRHFSDVLREILH